jgi:pseudaminic acid cytidylyltransferase
MTRRLAIIPARGNSKRLPHKNTRDFCGKPMIAHILETAKKSKLFEIIHVSTEDNKTAEIASSLGFPPEFSRPDHLADDMTPLMPVLKFTTEHYRDLGQEFDQVWLLMACAPLIEAADLERTAEKFDNQSKASAIIAVSPYPAPVEWAFALNSDDTLVPENPGMFAERSQDLEPKYFDSGTFAAFNCKMILASEGSGSDTDYIGYTLPQHKAIDIDDEDGWALAEAIYRGRRVL